jgi:hypothetical protein
MSSFEHGLESHNEMLNKDERQSTTTGNSGFAERIGLCRGPFVGPSAEFICAERRHRDRVTHGTTIFADGRTVGTARPSARQFLCRGLALGT